MKPTPDAREQARLLAALPSLIADPAKQWDVRQAIRALARARNPAAWPIICELYRTTKQSDIMNDAGWALRDYGDQRSLTAVEALVGDRNHTRIRHAFQVLLERLGSRVLDQLPDLSAQQAATVMYLVASEENDALREKRASRGWIQDPRWVTLARKWIGNQAVKSAASYVLSRAPVVPPVPKRKFRAPTAAQHAAAKRRMVALRKRVEVVVAALRAHKFRFQRPRHALGRPASARDLERLEQAVGPLPAIVRAAYLVLGEIDLRGTGPARLPALAIEDPLMFLPVSAVLEDALDHAGGESLFDLTIAPDAIAKAGFSGGRFSIEVPGSGAGVLEHLDGCLRRHELSLTSVSEK